MEDLKVFGERLRELRLYQGLSQTELAEKIGVSYASVSHYENNNKKPNGEVIMRVANYFNVSSDYILGLSEIRTNPDYLLEDMRGDRKIKKILNDPQVFNLSKRLLKNKTELKIMFLLSFYKNETKEKILEMLESLLDDDSEEMQMFKQYYENIDERYKRRYNNDKE